MHVSFQAPHWRICEYSGTERLKISAVQLAEFDIVLTTHQLMRMDSNLETERSLHQCVPD
jgi:hypothetical protein